MPVQTRGAESGFGACLSKLKVGSACPNWAQTGRKLGLQTDHKLATVWARTRRVIRFGAPDLHPQVNRLASARGILQGPNSTSRAATASAPLVTIRPASTVPSAATPGALAT